MIFIGLAGFDTVSPFLLKLEGVGMEFETNCHARTLPVHEMERA
jgi:hypothetical protein